MENVKLFLEAALECSVYISPLKVGLTRQELFEIARRAGYQDGEIGDALPQVGEQFFGAQEIKPAPFSKHDYIIFNPPEDPDYRNISAFDFVVRELSALERAVGQATAQIERDVLVQRAVAAGIAADDIEVAITCMSLAESLVERNGLLQLGARGPFTSRPLFSDQLKGSHGYRPFPKPHRLKAYPLVKDAIARRYDGGMQALSHYGRLRTIWPE